MTQELSDAILIACLPTFNWPRRMRPGWRTCYTLRSCCWPGKRASEIPMIQWYRMNKPLNLPLWRIRQREDFTPKMTERNTKPQSFYGRISLILRENWGLHENN